MQFSSGNLPPRFGQKLSVEIKSFRQKGKRAFYKINLRKVDGNVI
jgi:hypothetical protein